MTAYTQDNIHATRRWLLEQSKPGYWKKFHAAKALPLRKPKVRGKVRAKK